MKPCERYEDHRFKPLCRVVYEDSFPADLMLAFALSGAPVRDPFRMGLRPVGRICTRCRLKVGPPAC